MNYQNEHAYLFSSEKFNKAFGFTPTSYAGGINETVKWALREMSNGQWSMKSMK